MLDRRMFLKAGFAAAVAPFERLRAQVKQVRITGIDVYPVEVPVTREEAEALVNHRYLAVEVHTDGGVRGYSFAGPAVAELPRIRELLVGQNLFAIERHLRHGLARWGGVEHALWDAIGRIAQQPVYRLLGGSADRVQAYLTCVWKGNLDQSHVSYKEQADMAVRIRNAGYRGMKIRAWRPNPLDDCWACLEIKSAVGSGLELMFDRTAHAPESAGQRVWDYDTGLRVARLMEKHGAYWLEEPYARDDYAGPAKLAAAVDLLITGGEGYNGIEPFHQCLRHRTYDILQPDGRQVGGIFLARKVAWMAEADHVPVILHGTMALMLAGWLQASLAIGAEWQEVAILWPPLMPEQQWAPSLKLLRSPKLFEIRDGFLMAPAHPGIGLDVNADALREYRRKS